MSEPVENTPGGKESPEQTVDQRLFQIVEELGFRETPELVQAREKLKPDQLIDEARANIIAYQKLGETLVETKTDPSDFKPQIGLIVAMARLKYSNGFIDDYRDDMVNAALYATNMSEHETSLELRHILHKDLNGRPMGN